MYFIVAREKITILKNGTDYQGAWPPLIYIYIYIVKNLIGILDEIQLKLQYSTYFYEVYKIFNDIIYIIMQNILLTLVCFARLGFDDKSII